jgi:predicted transcriptional regulator
MKDLSSDAKPKNGHNKMMIDWRRNIVLELSSQGNNQVDIASILQVSEPTVSRDLSYLKKLAKTNIKKYIDERLPEEYEKCLVGLTSILKEAWTTAHNTEDKREKIQALSLAKECYSMKLDLLTNATVVDDAIRFVYGFGHTTNHKQKQQLHQRRDSTTIQEEEQKEEEAIDVNQVTKNQVF